MPCGKPKKDGSGPCQQPEGFGRGADSGPCKFHVDDDGTGESDRSDRHNGGRVDASDRPYGELTIERILDALRDGATYADAARAAGVSPRTFRRWRARYDDLRERVQRAEAESVSDALGVVQKAAEKGDWRAASWLLEKRHSYGDGGGDVPADEVRKFTDTVRDVIREELPDDQAENLIVGIGDALEEMTNG